MSMPSFLDAIGFKNLDPETAKRLDHIAAETVMNNVINRLPSLMSENDAAEARELWESGTDEGFERYLSAKGVNLSTLVTDEANTFLQLLTESGRIIRGEHD